MIWKMNMKSHSLKWFALLGLMLFLGVAVAPSINADVQKNLICNISPLFTASIEKAIFKDTKSVKTSYIGENKRQTYISTEIKTHQKCMNYLWKLLHY